MKPNIYIAGKIGKNDFRHALIPGLREHHPDSGPLDFGAFRYVGPFFESCDHGCRHGRNSHGVLGDCEPSCEPYNLARTRQIVWARNTQALRGCDGLFAFIETGDAYGSLVEIGMAQALRIPTRVVFGLEAPVADLWYATQQDGQSRRGRMRASPSALPDSFAAFVAEVSR